MTREKEPPDPIEEAMTAERKALGRLTRFHPKSQLSGRLLRAHNHLGRFVNGERDMFHREKLVVLTAAKISPRLHYELLLASLPELTPAEILQQLCCDPVHVCAESFLLELGHEAELLRLN